MTRRTKEIWGSTKKNSKEILMENSRKCLSLNRNFKLLFCLAFCCVYELKEEKIWCSLSFHSYFIQIFGVKLWKGKKHEKAEKKVVNNPSIRRNLGHNVWPPGLVVFQHCTTRKKIWKRCLVFEVGNQRFMKGSQRKKKLLEEGSLRHFTFSIFPKLIFKN